MKKYDFTKLGGFKETQKTLADMQAQSLVLHSSFGLGLPANTPVIISGCVFEFSNVSPIFTVTEGCIWYNGSVLKVEATNIDVSDQDTIPQLKIVTVVENVTYYNGSVHPSLTNISASVVGDGTGFYQFSAIKRLEEYRAVLLRGNWTVLKDNTDGYVRIRLDKLNKRCEVQGWTRFYQNLTSNPPTFMPIVTGAMPAAEIPANTSYIGFTAFRITHQVVPLSDYNQGEIRTMELFVQGSNLLISPKRPYQTVSNLSDYKFYFNFSYPIV